MKKLIRRTLGPEVLIVYAQPDACNVFSDFLVYCGVMPAAFSSYANAESLLRRQSFDVIFCEAGDGDLRYRRFTAGLSLERHTPFVLFSLHNQDEPFREAERLGAVDYLVPPFRSDVIEDVIQRARIAAPVSKRYASLATNAFQLAPRKLGAL